jgi:hypothetical protein
MSKWTQLSSGIVIPGLSMDERRQIARDKYYSQHSLCPACRSSSLETTTIGCISANPDEHFDSNTATCECGWSGPIDDLVAHDA